MTVWNPHGDFERAFALTPDGQVPMDAGDTSVYRLQAVSRWTSIGPAPTDMSEIAASGHVMIKGGAAPLVVYAGRNEPLAPLVHDATPWTAALSSERVHRRHGGVAGVLNGQLERIGPTIDRLHMARDHHAFFLGRGWSPVGVDETGAFRVVETEAELMIPCNTRACATADFQLSSESDGLVGLSVNGVGLDPQPLHPNWHRYRWSIPASALHPGMNSFLLKPSRVTLVADVLLGSKAAD